MPGPSLRVCFFGDSIVTGFGDETTLGWVGRVVAAARLRDDEWRSEVASRDGAHPTERGYERPARLGAACPRRRR